MSYTPTQWSAGDTVTSAKLNKMEQGIANAGGANILVAHISISNSDPAPKIIPTLDKTVGEILNADFIFVRMQRENETTHSYIYSITYDEGYRLIMDDGTNLYAETENDYPALDIQEVGGDNTPIAT